MRLNMLRTTEEARLYNKGEIFSWNTNQVFNASLFFYFKQHLLKAFFDKIKIDDLKRLLVAEKPGFKSDLLKTFSKCVDMCIEILLAKPNSTQQTVCKNIEKIRSRSITVGKNREITKSAVFLKFY